MNIQSVNGIVSRTNNVVKTVKDFVLWAGHKIQFCFQNYLTPIIKCAWADAFSAIKSGMNFLKTGPGILMITSASLFVFGIAALNHSQEQTIDQATWKTIGVSSIAASIASMGIVLLAL